MSFESNQADVIIELCGLLRDSVVIVEYPSLPVRKEAVVETLHNLVQRCQGLPFIVDNESYVDDVAHEICSCLVAFVTSETDIVVAADTFNLDLFKLLLLFLKGNRKISLLTFDAWLAVSDTGVSGRHPFLRCEIFAVILDIIYIQCRYVDNSMIESVFVACNGDEDFVNFRDENSGVQEILIICFNAMQNDFIAYLLSRLSHLKSLELSSQSSFQELEVVLHITQVGLVELLLLI